LPPSGETGQSHRLPHEKASAKKYQARLTTDDPPVPSCCLIQRHCAAGEALNSLYKKELIDREGPWRGAENVMLATLEWVDRYNTERLHSACGYIPPKEYEENYYTRQGNLVS
jgi:Integrase core domain